MSASTQETRPDLSAASTPLLEIQPGVSTLLTHAGFAPAHALGWIRVTGEDRVRWLNGMATNAIQALAPGEGCYNFFLSAQGRIQADATAWMQADSILLETAQDRVPPMIAMLDRFIIMDDVELQPLENMAGLLLAGPAAENTLTSLGFAVDELAPMRLAHTEFNRAQVDILHAYSPLVPRFELWADPATISKLTEALAHVEVPPVSAEALEALRLLEGTPRLGTDIRERELPQETAQPGETARALHFSKGCYLGQEIIERIHSRGNLHRTLSGFTLRGSLPAAGSPLFSSAAPEKPLGELTSAALIDLPGGNVTLALGYIRREALNQGAELHYPGGTATPASLPWQLSPQP